MTTKAEQIAELHEMRRLLLAFRHANQRIQIAITEANSSPGSAWFRLDGNELRQLAKSFDETYEEIKAKIKLIEGEE